MKAPRPPNCVCVCVRVWPLLCHTTHPICTVPASFRPCDQLSHQCQAFLLSSFGANFGGRPYVHVYVRRFNFCLKTLFLGALVACRFSPFSHVFSHYTNHFSLWTPQCIHWCASLRRRGSETPLSHTPSPSRSLLTPCDVLAPLLLTAVPVCVCVPCSCLQCGLR